MRLLAPILVASALACSPTVVVVGQPSPPAVASTAASIAVTADLRRRGTGQPSSLAPGQAVSEGDEITLYVQLNRDSYIYVVYVNANDAIAELYPQSGDVIVHNGVHRLPSVHGWWRLDAARGKEHFLVLAAASPLGEAMWRERAAHWRRPPAQLPRAPSPQGSASGPPRPPSRGTQSVQKRIHPPPPETSSAMDSESTRFPTQIVDTVVAEPDSDGVAMAVFTVDHR